jgi:hypothetical protein
MVGVKTVASTLSVGPLILVEESQVSGSQADK